jgi:hypothetical protein
MYMRIIHRVACMQHQAIVIDAVNTFLKGGVPQLAQPSAE